MTKAQITEENKKLLEQINALQKKVAVFQNEISNLEDELLQKSQTIAAYSGSILIACCVVLVVVDLIFFAGSNPVINTDYFSGGVLSGLGLLLAVFGLNKLGFNPKALLRGGK